MTPSQAERLKSYGHHTPIKVEPIPFGKTYDKARTIHGVRTWCMKNLKEDYDVFMSRHEAWNTTVAHFDVVCISRTDQDKVRAFFGPA